MQTVKVTYDESSGVAGRFAALLDPSAQRCLVSHMRCTLIGGLAAFGLASGLAAQSVPARDLWEFPLGALYEPSATAVEAGAGLWNPATVALASGERARFGVASLAAGSAQSVDGQLLTAAVRRSSGVTLGISLARTAIGGLARTETDPQILGDIPYASWLVSATAARDVVPHLTLGTAVRWRYGRNDQISGDAVSADFGAVLHDLPWRNARLAVSSFLWRPGREIEDRPALLSAADLRVAGDDELREVRAGASFDQVNRGGREAGLFLSGRRDRLEARVASLRSHVGGDPVTRWRSGLALHYTRFVVAIAREEGVSGLGAIYQFTLSSVLK